MAVSLQLGLKQNQKLILTQSLKQAIELLQLSTIELSEKISEELLENPVIEELDQPLPSTDSDDPLLMARINENLNSDESAFTSGEERLAEYGDLSEASYSGTNDEDRTRNYLENVIAQAESLTDHLLWQAGLMAQDANELAIYQNIITSLDGNGFLPAELSQIAREDHVSEEKLHEIISRVRLFDPVGCAVNGIQESLIVQAGHYYPDDTVLLRIVADHFVELEKLDYDKISRGVNIPLSLVIEKSKLIQNLDPYPGRQYSVKETRYIIPDVEVKLIDDEIIVTLNDEWLPRIRINSYYLDLLKKKSIEKKLKDYIQDKLQSARYLIKNISNRRETITKTVAAIMEYQREFLLKGPGHLKHLTNVDIAERIGMHESTVSRVTSNKFVQTGWGVFQLKYFFVSRIKAKGDEDHSSDQAMRLIKNIVDYETPAKPFSDEEIAAIMEKNGITIARRTIGKYRDILKIPSSGKRKKLNMIKSEENL